MKKIIIAIFFVLLFAGPAFGDEVDEGLSNMATMEIKTRTRSMIRTGIHSGDAIGMTRAMMENRFRQEHIIRAQEIVMHAHKEGLPEKPIMNKAYEGMAKRVQHENIIRAMEQVMARYAFAYQKACELTQAEAQRQRIMNQIAECVAAGITDHDVGRLMYELKYRIQERPKEEADGLVIETFGTVKDIARQRVSSMVATDLAIDALKHQYNLQKMQRMRQSFMKHTRDNSVQTVVETYASAIRSGKNLETLDFPPVNGHGRIGTTDTGAGSAGGWGGHGSSAGSSSRQGQGAGGSGGAKGGKR